MSSPVRAPCSATTTVASASRSTPDPENDRTAGALRVVEHGRDDGATAAVAVVRAWLDEPDVPAASIAVLARVNSLLLAPHVALHEAGVPISSVLRPDVLERTGMRAALAYLRLATSADAMATDDIVEILRRPTRGLPQWFPERLGRRSRWSLAQLAALVDQVPDKEGGKVLRLADDLGVVLDVGRTGTTRSVLEAVRDEIGLGTAMSLLDRTGGGQGSSHLDDLEGLLGVADLHPDPTGFEPWLRTAFSRESTPGGVTLSTIHRVKGREWDRVAVFGVADGIVPHRLAEDIEEERRVLHVAITRCRHRVTVLADRTRPSPFLAELAGTAPHRPAPRPVAEEREAGNGAATTRWRHRRVGGTGADRAGRVQRDRRGRRRPRRARSPVVGQHAARALRRARRAQRPSGAARRARRAVGSGGRRRVGAAGVAHRAGAGRRCAAVHRRQRQTPPRHRPLPPRRLRSS